MALVGSVLSTLIWLYLLVLTARATLSLVPLFAPGWHPRGLSLVFAEGVYTLTDPPLRLVGRFIKPIRVGEVAFDVGFLVLYIGLSMLQRLVVVVFS